jgi:TRAP-type mannitol/chloroaromatic compound transport system permease small subunit
MPDVLTKYVKYMDAMSTGVGKWMQYGIIMLVGILLIEAFTRTVFNAPRIWAVELATFTLGAYFLIGGGYTLLRGEHVRMDIFYSRWSLRKRAIVDLATFPTAIIYLVVCVLGGINSIEFSLRTNHHSVTLWAPPLAPIKIIITIACVLLLLQVVASMFRDVSIIKGKPIS